MTKPADTPATLRSGITRSAIYADSGAFFWRRYKPCIQAAGDTRLKFARHLSVRLRDCQYSRTSSAHCIMHNRTDHTMIVVRPHPIAVNVRTCDRRGFDRFIAWRDVCGCCVRAIEACFAPLVLHVRTSGSQFDPARLDNENGRRCTDHATATITCSGWKTMTGTSTFRSMRQTAP